MSMGAFKAAMDEYISYKFGRDPVLLQLLMRLTCVQQASISTLLNSSRR